jgi:hypothetical protein
VRAIPNRAQIVDADNNAKGKPIPLLSEQLQSLQLTDPIETGNLVELAYRLEAAY